MPRFFHQLIADPNTEFPRISTLWHDCDICAFNFVFADVDQVSHAFNFKLQRNPRNLIAHLRRIYFCFQNQLSSQLYAALLDLLIVLDGNGQAICLRMIGACRSQLDQQQLLSLGMTIKSHQFPKGNRYSLFTKDLVGKSELVSYQPQRKEPRDILALANDFIEYSQLEQAMEVLENGVMEFHDRQDLQLALLELYKSVVDNQRFDKFYNSLKASGAPLVDEWLLTAKFLGNQLNE